MFKKLILSFTVILGALIAPLASNVANTDSINPESEPIVYESFEQDFLETPPIYAQNTDENIVPDSNLSEQINLPDSNLSELDTDINTPEQNIQPKTVSCPAKIFTDSLISSSSKVTESDPEHIIQIWIYQAFQNPETIQQVLDCPDVKNLSDTETIKFQTIEYMFPGGRHIVINYETQPKILKQRLAIETKRGLPETNPNPKIGAYDDPTIWTNTEPAWYAILVTEAGSLDKFVGPDKNNTLSLKYLEQNIDDFFPKNSNCTSKSALANDNETINIAAHKTVHLGDKDSNDYYVAGDVNLQWITWGQVGLDIAITVATVGGGTILLGATKAARSTKVARGLVTSIKSLEKMDTVKDYLAATRKLSGATNDLKKINKATDAAAHAKKLDEITDLTKSLKGMETIDDVKKYKNATEAFSDTMKLRRSIKAWRIPQRGNTIARAWRSLRAINTGNKTLNKGAKIARASLKSGKIRDWMFHSTMKNIGKLAKFERNLGLLYGGIKFVGDMYDWSETSTGEFTNNIEFKPLGLLSADDLEGQDNVVNHGMWLMWLGDSTSAVDDNAAYLQSMDFAAKFHQDLQETMEDTSHNCSVDIHVVRPIIRNPDSLDEGLYYLIMNDIPWTTKQ